MNTRRAAGFLTLWALFVGYAFVLAPPDDPAFTRRLLEAGILLRDTGVDPLVVAVFSALGVVPVVYAALLLPQGRRQPLATWPFVLAMMGVGGFALLPYLALRSDRVVDRGPSRVHTALRHRAVGVLTLGGLVALGLYGLTRGSVGAYAALFASNRFVHVMSLDLALCGLLMPYAVSLARAGDAVDEAPWARWLGRLPLVGGPLWCALVRRREHDAG